MRIKIKISNYVDQNQLSNVYYELSIKNYIKKIKSSLYVNKKNYSSKIISIIKDDNTHITKNIILKKLFESKSKTIKNYKSGQWNIQECEKYLKIGLELYSVKKYIDESFNHLSIFTKKDYINTVNVYKKHLDFKEDINIRDFNYENLLKFKQNLLYSGLKASSINSYIKKIKVIVNKAYKDGRIIKRDIFENIMLKENNHSINKNILSLKNIETAINKTTNIYELQSILFFLISIIFKGIRPIDLIKYRKIDKTQQNNHGIGNYNYIAYNYFNKEVVVRIDDTTKKIIKLLKNLIYITHQKKDKLIVSSFNKQYEIFNPNIALEVSRHKNLWNIYQRNLKKILGCNFRMAKRIYKNELDKIEISKKTRDIILGNSSIIKNKELIQKVFSAENIILENLQIKNLFAIIENKIKILGLENSLDYSNISKPIGLIRKIT